MEKWFCVMKCKQHLSTERVVLPPSYWLDYCQEVKHCSANSSGTQAVSRPFWYVTLNGVCCISMGLSCFFPLWPKFELQRERGDCSIESNSIKTEGHTQAFHTYRINLSPFTKDFRVWEAIIETKSIYLWLPVGSFSMNCCIAVHDGCWLMPIVLMPLPQLSAVVAPVTVQAHFAPG